MNPSLTRRVMIDGFTERYHQTCLAATRQRPGYPNVKTTSGLSRLPQSQPASIQFSQIWNSPPSLRRHLIQRQVPVVDFQAVNRQASRVKPAGLTAPLV